MVSLLTTLSLNQVSQRCQMGSIEEPGLLSNTLFPLMLYDVQDFRNSRKLEMLMQKAIGSPKDSILFSDNSGTFMAHILGNLGDVAKPFILEMINVLQDKTQNIDRRVSIARLLGDTGDAGKSFAPEITNLFKDKTQDPKVRIYLTQFLGNMGDIAKPLIPDMTNLLKDKTIRSSDRYNLVLTLKNLDYPMSRLVPDFLNILKDETQTSSEWINFERPHVLTILGDNAAKPFAADIANLLKDKARGNAVRQISALALGELGDAAKPFIPDLLNVLNDKNQDDWLRRDVASGLGKLGEIPMILRFIQDKTQDTRGIQQQPTDEQSTIRGNVASILPELGNRTKPFMMEIASIFKDEKQEIRVRIAAANVLIKLGDAAKPFIPDILNAIINQRTNSDLRDNISFLDELYASNSFIPQIRTILNDKTQSVAVRVWAGGSLLNLKDAAKPFISDLLNFIQGEKQGSTGMGRDLSGLVSQLEYFGDRLIPDLRQILNDRTQEPLVRGRAAQTLANFGNTANVAIPDMLVIIRDKKQPFEVRSRTSRALSSLGGESNSFTSEILNIIKTVSYNNGDREADRLRDTFSWGFGSTQLKFDQVLPFVDMAEFTRQEPDESWRFSAYFQSGGSDEIKMLLKWVGRAQLNNIPTKLSYEDGVKTLTLFAKTWESSQNLPDLRRSLISPIAAVTEMVQWKPGDKPLLNTHYQNLITTNPESAKVLKDAIDRLDLE
jgi:HEAT repeat protein